MVFYRTLLIAIILIDVSVKLAKEHISAAAANPLKSHRRRSSQLSRVSITSPARQHHLLFSIGRSAMQDVVLSRGPTIKRGDNASAEFGRHSCVPQPATIVDGRLCSVVRMKRSKEELAHCPTKCFRFWKEKMANKYGHVH
jgi:hypothetical protein